MNDANIIVADHILITDINIAVTLTHESFFDLEIVLQSPAGTIITLNPHSNKAFIITDDNDWQTPVGGTNRFLFDDEAEIPIDRAVEPWDQPFKPYDKLTLSAFDGQDAFGQWRLQILDAWPPHIGQLHKVELVFNSPEPASVCLFGVAFAAVGLLKDRKNGNRK